MTGVAAGLLGLGLLGLGVWLLLLGGSPYYAAAGLMLLAAGILIVLGRPAGIWLYAALLVGTVLWSLYEVGLDGWALIPRLVAPAVLGIWLFISPWVLHFSGMQNAAVDAWIVGILFFVIGIWGVVAVRQVETMHLQH